MKFSELGLAEPVLRAVTAAGYSVPTPIQQQAIPPVAAGRDLLGCAQTGTGKTAAFALPIIHRLTAQGNPPAGRGRRIRALVLSPTRELASQIHESFVEYGRGTPLRQCVVFGGVSQQRQTRALQHGVDILVATPGRLLDLMNQGFVDLRHVEIFVLDEADRMLDMGFLPDVRRVIRQVPQSRQTLLFSATMPESIRSLADSILRDPVQVHIAPVQATADQIEQSVYLVPQHNKPQLLAHLLGQAPVHRALVFTRTKHGADGVVRKLLRAGIRAEAIHGNKSQNARQRALANFKQSRTHVLVATDIAARGIDVDGISHVLNYDLPREPETYVHRIGRTGRAGATGIAVSFCDRAERTLLASIEREIRRAIPIRDDHPAYATERATASQSGETTGTSATAQRDFGKRPGGRRFDKPKSRRPSGGRGHASGGRSKKRANRSRYAGAQV